MKLTVNLEKKMTSGVMLSREDRLGSLPALEKKGSIGGMRMVRPNDVSLFPDSTIMLGEVEFKDNDGKEILGSGTNKIYTRKFAVKDGINFTYYYLGEYYILTTGELSDLITVLKYILSLIQGECGQYTENNPSYTSGIRLKGMTEWIS